MTRWPVISLANIFAYILEKRICDREYTGCYKDQKAYSYWDSGLVGPIYIYETHIKKIMCFYTIQLQHQKL